MPPLSTNNYNSDRLSAMMVQSESSLMKNHQKQLQLLEFEEPASFQEVEPTSAYWVDNVPVADSSGKIKIVDHVLVSDKSDFAYVVRKTLRRAIYGKVVLASVLQKEHDNYKNNNGVLRAQYSITSAKCAIKIMSITQMERNEQKPMSNKSKSLENPRSEMAVMEHLKRSNVCQNVLTPIEIVSDENNVFVMLPLCRDGELFDKLDATKGEGFSEAEAKYWFKQLMEGIRNLHKAGVCHRDISLENTLLHDDQAFIIDFGMAIRMPQSGNTLMTPSGTCGKMNYMSPEIYQNMYFDGAKADVWSAGVALFMMLTGAPAYETPDSSDPCFRWITEGKIERLMDCWERNLSYEVIDLLEGIFCVDFHRRMSVDEILSHPWLQ